jgi:hypothetical protein
MRYVALLPRYARFARARIVPASWSPRSVRASLIPNNSPTLVSRRRWLAEPCVSAGISDYALARQYADAPLRWLRVRAFCLGARSRASKRKAFRAPAGVSKGFAYETVAAQMLYRRGTCEVRKMQNTAIDDIAIK